MSSLSGERTGAAVRPFPTPPGGPSGYDRVPPHNLDAEVSVLGSMLLSRDAIAEVTEIVHPEDFYRGAHRTMFEAICDLYDRGEPVDPVTMADELSRRSQLEDVGGGVAIAELVRRVPTAANALHYARIVSDHAVRRRLIDVGGNIARLGFEAPEGADEAVDQAERLVYEVGQRDRVSDFTSMKDLVAAGFELIERLHENQSAITGLATGFHDLDELTAGLQPSNLVILAARPAMGKCCSGATTVCDPTTGAVRRLDEIVDGGLEPGPTVAALDDRLRLAPRRVGAVHANGVMPVWRLRTRLGRELVATANHPLLTADGWQELGALAVGERIATARVLPYFGADALPECEVELLAALVGGGDTGSVTPRLATASTRGRPDRLTRRLTHRPEHHGLMGGKSATRVVPEAVFRLPRGHVALFLNRLFACGARVAVDDSAAQVTYTSSSETLGRQVQHLLLRFGVIARLREPEHAAYEGTDERAWELQVTDPPSIRTFAAEIGILGKDDRLARAVAPGDSRPGASPHRNLVPAGAFHDQTPGEATSDVYWDEIVAIEPAGEERVYDLTVPGLHNFVANDLVVHNSTMVTNIATNVAVDQRKPVVLFSLEMSQMELTQRILAGQARVDSGRLRTGRLQDADWPKLSQAVGRIAEAPLYIDDTPGINLMEIRSKCRRLKQRHGLDLVIVDYLQLMQATRRVENRVQEVSELSRGLKILAKELDVPVVALSQLSRRPEERHDRRPQLSDLRESGALEQDADVVAFIYRDEVYDPETPAKGEAELIVAKHRNGPLRTIRLSFIGHQSRFADMARVSPNHGLPPGTPPPPSAPPPGAGPL